MNTIITNLSSHKFNINYWSILCFVPDNSLDFAFSQYIEQNRDMIFTNDRLIGLFTSVMWGISIKKVIMKLYVLLYVMINFLKNRFNFEIKIRTLDS